MTPSLRGEVWAYKSSLIPPLLIEVPVPRQDSERSIFLLSTILMFDFGIFLTLWYFFFLPTFFMIESHYVPAHVLYFDFEGT